MSSRIQRTEGGHKRGHSNVCHWEYTEIIKREGKKKRRQQDHHAIEEQTEGGPEPKFVVELQTTRDRYPTRLLLSVDSMFSAIQTVLKSIDSMFNNTDAITIRVRRLNKEAIERS